MSWLKTRWARLSAPKFTGDWYEVHFVAGLRAPRGTAWKFDKDAKPLTLAEKVLPGFSVAGTFTDRMAERVGKVTLVYGEEEASRNYPEFPSFYLYAYPDRGGQRALKELWARLEEGLDALYLTAFEARMALGPDLQLSRSALGRLACLKQKATLKDVEARTVSLLEAAPVFHDCQYASPIAWRLADLRGIEKIGLVSWSEGYAIRGRPRRPGWLFFERTTDMSTLCDIYNLPAANPAVAMDAAQVMARKFITPEERQNAFEIAFCAPLRQGHVVSFGENLVLDFERKLIRGRKPESPEVEIPFASITRLDIEVSETIGDAKTHVFFHMVIANERHDLRYYGHYREYSEGGVVQRELDREYAKAQAIMHAIPGALEFPGARMERGDLVPVKSFFELVGRT